MKQYVVFSTPEPTHQKGMDKATSRSYLLKFSSALPQARLHLTALLFQGEESDCICHQVVHLALIGSTKEAQIRSISMVTWKPNIGLISEVRNRRVERSQLGGICCYRASHANIEKITAANPNSDTMAAAHPAQGPYSSLIHPTRSVVARKISSILRRYRKRIASAIG